MNQFIGTGPYKQDGAGTIWPPEKDDDNYPENFVENLREHVEQDVIEEPFLGSWDVGSFETEEIYVDEDHSTGKKYLEINGQVDGVMGVYLRIPVENNSRMKKVVEELAEEVTIDRERAGLYLPPDDFEEVRTKTADGQCRINLGVDRAGKDVKVVVIE